MTACPITGHTNCTARTCELHYMDAPIRLAPAVYADLIMARIAHDEWKGPLQDAVINSYSDLHTHVDPNEYTTQVGIDQLHGPFVNDVETLVDKQLKTRAVIREQLEHIVRAMRAIADIDATGDLAILADTRSNLHRSLWTAAYDLALALVRLASPTIGQYALEAATAALTSYNIDPDPQRTVADRILDALTPESPF